MACKYALYDLAVQVEHKTQHLMRCRMLGQNLR
jgi:hypothetical protein